MTALTRQDVIAASGKLPDGEQDGYSGGDRDQDADCEHDNTVHDTRDQKAG